LATGASLETSIDTDLGIFPKLLLCLGGTQAEILEMLYRFASDECYSITECASKAEIVV
jgi:hypothetical protein